MKIKKSYENLFEEEMSNNIPLERYNKMSKAFKNIIDARIAYKVAIKNKDYIYEAINDVIKNPYYAFLFVKDVLKAPDNRIYQVLKDTEFEYDYEQLFKDD